jgi:hypothetical protein
MSADNSKQARPYLTPENADKIRKIAMENNMSDSQVLNRVIDSVSVFELHQIVTFIVEVRQGSDPIGRKVAMRRRSNWTIRP